MPVDYLDDYYFECSVQSNNMVVSDTGTTDVPDTTATVIFVPRQNVPGVIYVQYRGGVTHLIFGVQR